MNKNSAQMVNGVISGKCVECEALAYLYEYEFLENGKQFIHWSCKPENQDKYTVVFKIGDSEVKIAGGVPLRSKISQEGKDTMMINNALSELSKAFGFDVQSKFPNIRDTARIIRNSHD